MPTTILAQKKNNILRLFGRGLSLEPEAPATWATSRKANETWKNKKKTRAKQKNCKMFCFDSKDVFCCVPYLFFLNGKEKKNFFFLGYLNGYDQSRSQKKTQCVFWLFTIFGLVFCIEKSQKTKTTWVFLFFEILIDRIHSNNQNTQYFLFLHFRTKKKETKATENKKTSFESKPNILSKSFVFWVVWFCSSSLFFSCSIYSHEWPYPSNFLNNLPLSPCSGIVPNEDIKHWHMYMYGNPWTQPCDSFKIEAILSLLEGGTIHIYIYIIILIYGSFSIAM